MFNHNDLFELQSQSLKMQSMVRQKTFLPDDQKILRRFSSWEVAARENGKLILSSPSQFHADYVTNHLISNIFIACYRVDNQVKSVSIVTRKPFHKSIPISVIAYKHNRFDLQTSV